MNKSKTNSDKWDRKKSGFPRNIGKPPKKEKRNSLYRTHVQFRPFIIGMLLEAGFQYAEDKGYEKSFAYYLVDSYVYLQEKSYRPYSKRLILEDCLNDIRKRLGNTCFYKYKKRGIDIADEIVTFLQRLRLIHIPGTWKRVGKRKKGEYIRDKFLIVNPERYFLGNTTKIEDPYWRKLIKKNVMPADWKIKRVFITKDFLQFINQHKPIRRVELFLLAVLLLQRSPHFQPITYQILANAMHTSPCIVQNLNKILVEQNYVINKDAYVYDNNKVKGDVRLLNDFKIGGMFLHIGHRSYTLEKLGFAASLQKGEYDFMTCKPILNEAQLKDYHWDIVVSFRNILKERLQRKENGKPSGVKRSTASIRENTTRYREYRYSYLTRDQIYSIENRDRFIISTEACIYPENLKLSSNKPNYKRDKLPARIFDDRKMTISPKKDTTSKVGLLLHYLTKHLLKITVSNSEGNLQMHMRKGIKDTKLIRKTLASINHVNIILADTPSDSQYLQTIKRKAYQLGGLIKHMFQSSAITIDSFQVNGFYYKQTYYKINRRLNKNKITNMLTDLGNEILKTYTMLYKYKKVHCNRQLSSYQLSENDIKKVDIMKSINEIGKHYRFMEVNVDSMISKKFVIR